MLREETRRDQETRAPVDERNPAPNEEENEEEDRIADEPPETSNYRHSGDPEECCQACLHFSEGVCNLYKARVEPDYVSDGFELDPNARKNREADEEEARRSEREGEENTQEAMEPTMYKLAEVYLSESPAEEKDGLVWKEIFHEGRWELTPDGLTGIPVDRPMEFFDGKGTEQRDDIIRIGMQDVLDAFDDKAIDNVTVPVQPLEVKLGEHADKTLQNTGFVRQLKKGKRQDGKTAVFAGIEFTEPDIKEKVERGTIPASSAGFAFDYPRKKDGKVFPIALQHNALTHRPWMAGMEPFGTPIGFSEGDTLEVISLAEKPVGSGANGIDEESGGGRDPGNRRSPEKRAPATARDIMISHQEAREHKLMLADGTDGNPGGGEKMGTINENQLEALGLSEEQQEAVTTLLTSRDDKIEGLRKDVHKRNVDDKILKLSEKGFEEFPSVLKKARELMLADDSGTALLLSETDDEGKPTGKERGMTVTEVVDSIFDSFPTTDDGKLDLGEQHLGSLGLSEERRATTRDDSDTRSAAEKAKETAEFLGDQRYLATAPKGGE